MAIPSSGQLKLSLLIAEFGGGVKLTDFYRGGGLVPDSPANAGLPTSGSIKLTDSYGAVAVAPLTASAAPVNLAGFGATSTVTTAASATCTAEGGTGTLAYSWERVSGSTKIAPVNTGSASTQFRATNLIGAEAVSAVFRCKVTRGTETTYSNNINVALERG